MCYSALWEFPFQYFLELLYLCLVNFALSAETHGNA